MKKLNTILFFITAITLYPSCKKGDTIMNPDHTTLDSITIMGFKDSTQLIKSISDIGLDSLGNPIDTNIIYFYYDTINKKINLNSEYVASAIPSQYSVVLSYNNAGLIIQQKGTDTNWVSTTDYTYDAQNVLNSETTTDNNGVETVHLTKKALPSGGYSLSTESSQTNFVHDSILNTYNFDATGKLILRSDLGLPSLNGGYIDSTVYDASGNISKVIETSLGFDPTPSTYTLFEFNSRDTKGNQLYNLNNILYNGIAEFPEAENNIALGGLFNNYDNFYYYQFTKYPSLSTKVYQQYSNSYVTFNPSPQYDSKDRLIKYKMYNGDNPYYYEEYDINYFK